MFKLLLVVLNSRAKVQKIFHIRKRESACTQFIPYFRQFLHMREGRSLQQGVSRSQKSEVRNQKRGGRGKYIKLNKPLRREYALTGYPRSAPHRALKSKLFVPDRASNRTSYGGTFPPEAINIDKVYWFLAPPYKNTLRSQKCPKIASQCGCNNPYAPNGFLKVSATNDFL